jgi:hypothetical protein
MHDGAQGQFSRAVRGVLCDTDHGQWIGRGGHTAWPPLSPDFNPLDVYIWGLLNHFVCAVPVDNEQTLNYRTVDACQTIHNCPAIYEWMRRSMGCVEACDKSHGRHFEHLLKCTLSAITHKIVYKYMDMW